MLYIGVPLAVILAAVGLSDLSHVKDIEKKLKDVENLNLQNIKSLASGLPIQIMSPAPGYCQVDGGYVEIPPVPKLAVQWYNTTNVDYYVIFQANQDPFGKGALDAIEVKPDGTPYGGTMDPTAVKDCTVNQQCVFSYTIGTKADGSNSCLPGSVGTYGVVVKPPGGGIMAPPR